MDKILKKHSIKPGNTVREAMRRINELSGDSQILFVVDDDREIIGTITDGDIRRRLIDGGELENKVVAVMNPNFLYAKSFDELSQKMAEGRKRRIELLPVIINGKLNEIIDLRVMKACLPVEAVLMAGGRGERLRPLTDNLPKPLLPVAGKPIIDYNVDELETYGVKKIYVTVNYLANLITEHFEKRKGRAKIDCVKEPKRLGTFGSLAYIDGIESQDIIVLNSDLLSKIDFAEMYLHHKNSGADFTIAAVPYSVSVPFAILRSDDKWINSIEEKPTFNYFANGGVYILKSKLIESIPKGEYLDAPDFIMNLIQQGKKVGSFHIDGTWVDIGSPDDYRMANELASRHL